MPIYEGDGGTWLKKSKKMGKRVVPGTNRPLFPCNVGAALPKVKDESIFTTVARRAMRARRGSPEIVIGYRFTPDLTVAFRGVRGMISTNVKVGPTLKSAVGTFTAEDEALANTIFSRIDPEWWLDTSALTFPTFLKLLRERTALKNRSLFASEGRVLIACFRRIAVQSLLLQNVSIEGLLEEGEVALIETEALMDDLADLELDFF